jgi:uncharacterized protein YbjT (DUF2867 family)
VTSACHAAQKAAFEIVEIEQQVLALSEAEAKQHLDPASLLDGLQDGFRRLELGEIHSPPRPEITVPIGAGVQAREHLEFLPLVRGLDHINVCSLHLDDARKLARRSPLATASGDIEAAVRESDIVCLATHSAMPVIPPDWVKPGTANLLPGRLAATRTGLSPASDDELADQSSITHMINTNLSGHTGDAR